MARIIEPIVWVSEGNSGREVKAAARSNFPQTHSCSWESQARDDVLGVESVHWVGRVALSREGRIRLNLDRLGQRGHGLHGVLALALGRRTGFNPFCRGRHTCWKWE